MGCLHCVEQQLTNLPGHNLKLDAFLDKCLCLFAASAEDEWVPPFSRTTLPPCLAFSDYYFGDFVLWHFMYACSFSNKDFLSVLGC
jgi:hypothetical protein